MLRITYDQTPRVNFALGSRFICNRNGDPLFSNLLRVIDYVDPATNTFDYARLQADLNGAEGYIDWQAPFAGVLSTVVVTPPSAPLPLLSLLLSTAPVFATLNILQTNLGQAAIVNQLNEDRNWASFGNTPSDYVFSGQLTSRTATIIANANTTSVVKYIDAPILPASSGAADAALVLAEGSEVFFNHLDETMIPLTAITYLSLRGTLTRIGNVANVAARRVGPSPFLD